MVSSWQPQQMAVLQDVIDQVNAKAIALKSGSSVSTSFKCHFGHYSQQSHKQRFLVRWRGVPFDGQLCQTCWKLAKAEVNAPAANVVWLADAPPPADQPLPRCGPCFFGHSKSSATRAYGAQAWYTLPHGLVFNECPTGATLCASCYAAAWRHGVPIPGVGVNPPGQSAEHESGGALPGPP